MRVDIVIPVYNCLQFVVPCISSVLECRQKTQVELIVVDDASEELEVAEYLDRLAMNGQITLLRNNKNQGFVKSANLGMQMHADRDIVLLNSDTEVANDWLDRLRECAYSENNIGTVTPFSNNATICSFPEFCKNNPLPEGTTLPALDAMFARVNRGKSVTIPTAVGFCMYIRRACADEIGLFDEARFGRGYGEENDFCRRAMKAGWSNILCADTFVHHVGSASFGDQREELAKRSETLLDALHPDYLGDVRNFIRHDPAAPLRRTVEIELARALLEENDHRSEHPSLGLATPCVCLTPCALAISAETTVKPVQLHVLHDLAGGIERWCRDFCKADTDRVNLILKPYCRGHAAGEGLMLFANIDDPEPIGLWVFADPFEVTTTSHPEYAWAIRNIIDTYGVQAVLVSSLIGHSLEILDTGIPTAYITHDYFPLCPAINLYFNGICENCDDARLIECLKNNPDFNPFLLFSADERLAVRQRLLEIIASKRVSVVSPCRTVWNSMLKIFPGIHNASWVSIPHGMDNSLVPIQYENAGQERFRVVVLGILSVNKGLHLLTDALDRLTEFADIYLVGAMEVGELFANHPSVHVVTRYALDELQNVVGKIRPHAGLLLSIWPETYSYTLSELMRMGVPTVATRVGSFSERIIDGETGFLVEPNADAVVTKLKQLAVDPAALDIVRSNLINLIQLTATEMVADYHRLLPLSPSNKNMTQTPHAQPSLSDALSIRQAVAITSLWKKVKSLDLQLTMAKESRPSLQGPGQVAESQRRIAERQLAVAENQRVTAEHHRTIAEHHRAVAEHSRAVAEQQREIAESQFAMERLGWNERLNQAAGVTQQRDAHIHALNLQLEIKDRKLAEIYSSTSWRLSRPVRMAGTIVRGARLLASLLVAMLKEPQTLPKHVALLFGAWRSGGLLAFKTTVRHVQAALAHQNAWKAYHRSFDREVRPRIIQAVTMMANRPLISVIVPTFNTDRRMLAQMLASVQGQLYGNWELCIADDNSTEPHVERMLKECAHGDSRIKLHFSDENKGVSNASNRALDMVSGDFVILLDHDDILEPQALFRVAQAITDESPDMLYSDEILLSGDLKKVLQYAYRPAFSLELLRSHPYIVHMVGFRTQIMRDIGGFDESLSISQDYDLILRAAEQSATIVHIPEILYQWRIHASSSGTRRREEVMATSKAILRRHLQRCGDAGEVNDGVRFNLFDVRYPILDGARIAIIIPTKNHGELVRQCIESIRATVAGIPYDIVVIDHESDDPETVAYLSSIAEEIRVLRYVGPFNFSAINNWAVRQLKGSYSHYLLCNNDIEATKPGWLERMLELGQRSDVGIVGAQLLYPDHVTIQHAGVCVGAFGAAEHYGKFIRVTDIPLYPGFSEILSSNHEVSAVTAACLLIRKEVFEAVNGFDEALAVGFGDVDLCLRVNQLGYRILYCPYAVLIHHESLTRGKTTGIDPHPGDSAFFQSRWHPFLQAGDPYFNPGLNQNSTAWQMRQPMKHGFEIRCRVWKYDQQTRRQQLLI